MLAKSALALISTVSLHQQAAGRGYSRIRATNRSVYLLDRSGTQPFSESPLRIQWQTGPNYYISPSPAWVIPASLGDPTASLQAGYWTAVYGLQFFRGNYSAAQGEWTAVSFSAGNFTGSGTITWTVTSGEVTQNRYMLVGKTMTWSIHVDASTLAGVGNTLLVTIPGGFRAANPMECQCRVLDNSVEVSGYCFVSAGDTQIHIRKIGAGNWTASAGTYVRVTMMLEVQ